jgi:hypothetical protein
MSKKDDILIGTFMNYERDLERGNYTRFWYHIPDPKYGVRNKQVFTGFWDDELPFSKSWEYLIPIIRKCKKISLDKNGEWIDSYKEKLDEIIYPLSDFNIKEIYRKVINFIKFYNESLQH